MSGLPEVAAALEQAGKAQIYAEFHTSIFDDLVPWLVEFLSESGSAQDAGLHASQAAFGRLGTLMELDDEERSAGRCGPGKDRATWGGLFEDIFLPQRDAVIGAVFQSRSFVEACRRTTAIVLPGVPVPRGADRRWEQTFWRWRSEASGPA